MKNRQLTVIDFFSGAGGFSEGFRQQGFRIVKGIDYWEPAVKTHNLNHDLNDTPENILDYLGFDSGDVSQIESLPDVDVIIGSPSCVTFSMSNRGGKADKTEGIRLIESYLRVIAVKKHKKKSQLKAWLMENVPNSGNYVKRKYTFKDLRLELWAKSNSLDPSSVALTLNGVVLNASDYGAPQHRNRFICGEFMADGEFPMPEATNNSEIILKEIKSRMPKPNLRTPTGSWKDPNYPGLILKSKQLTDHFYDTGLYITEWEQARYLKTMHPFMGKMSFPEVEDRPSRTITATKSVCTREALIYRSEYNRSGHGMYRSPTIREAATLMGYPYSYQFIGSESIKWKLIGNSVSPQLSSALAKSILYKQGLNSVPLEKIKFKANLGLHPSVNNLNSFSPKAFDIKRVRKNSARFRRALYKGQNTTIDLLNYHPDKKIVEDKWYVVVFYGTGMNHKKDLLNHSSYKQLGKILASNFDLFEEFSKELGELFDNGLTSKILQDSYENDTELKDARNPLLIAERIQTLCDGYADAGTELRLSVKNMKKTDFPLVQLLYMYSLAYAVNDCLASKSKATAKARFSITDATQSLVTIQA